MKPLGSAASVLASMRDEAQGEIERIEQESEAAVAKSTRDEPESVETSGNVRRLKTCVDDCRKDRNVRVALDKNGVAWTHKA